MANTPNLNLIELIYDNTKKVKDFFMNEIIGKTNSNNTKIDTAITEKITQVALKSSLPTSPTTSNNLYIVYGDTKNNNGQYRWNGTTYEKISTQLDYATKAEAEAGADNTKVMTPQRVRDFFIANGGGSGGVTNVVFQSGKKYYKFTVTAVTNNFEIPSNLFNPTTDVVELIHGGNIPLIKDENYTLVGNLVTFIGYLLDINDDIHCLITNTAYSYNALVDTPDLTLKLDTTGDAKDTTVTFTEATTRENLASEDKTSVLWGKQSKINNDFETLKADKPIVIGGSGNIKLIGEIQNYTTSKAFYLDAILYNMYLYYNAGSSASFLTTAFLKIGQYGNDFGIEGKMQILNDFTLGVYKAKIQVTSTGKIYAINNLYNDNFSWKINNKSNNIIIYRKSTIVSSIDGNVIWDSELYKTNIATSQQMEEITDNYLGIQNELSIDINTVNTIGIYWCSSDCTNLPINDNGQLTVKYVTRNNKTVLFQEFNSWNVASKKLNAKFERIFFNGSWGVWQGIGLTDKIDILFPYNNGCEAVYPEDENKIYKNSLNIVSIFATVKKSDDSVLPTVFATLPVGYRPTKNITTMGRVILATDNTIHTIPVIVFANGNIETRNIYSVVKQLSFSITYYTV